MMDNFCELTIYNNNFFLKKKLFSLLYEMILHQSRKLNNYFYLYDKKL
jgi:hypothetical protein